VQREHLVDANTRVEGTRSIARLAGPTLAGVLVQVLGPSTVFAANALTFLASAASVATIQTRESVPAAVADPRGLRGEIADGLRLVLGNPLLRSIAACTASRNLFFQMLLATFVLYATRDLEIEPGLLGLIMAAIGPGTIVGVLLAGAVPRRFGTGPAIVGSALGGGVATLLIPLAGAFATPAIPVLALGLFLVGLFLPLYTVSQLSLRQALTPERLLGRSNGTTQFIVMGTAPLGAILGGVLGELLGLRTTLVVAGFGSVLAAGWVLASPLRTVRAAPAPRPVGRPEVIAAPVATRTAG
jgi:predicted MFS family arabinose efflux permease